MPWRRYWEVWRPPPKIPFNWDGWRMMGDDPAVTVCAVNLGNRRPPAWQLRGLPRVTRRLVTALGVPGGLRSTAGRWLAARASHYATCCLRARVRHVVTVTLCGAPGVKPAHRVRSSLVLRPSSDGWVDGWVEGPSAWLQRAAGMGFGAQPVSSPSPRPMTTRPSPLLPAAPRCSPLLPAAPRCSRASWLVAADPGSLRYSRSRRGPACRGPQSNHYPAHSHMPHSHMPHM
jgi:hypothetical protein